MSRIVVFISGKGTNLQALIDATKKFDLCANIVAVFSNNPNAYGINRAERENIPVEIQPWNHNSWANRVSYDHHVARLTRGYAPDLVVLAGWMHIFTDGFISNVNCPVINLHPALPGKFPGKQAIKDAWKAWKNGEIHETGIMIHHVVPEIDAGEVILCQPIPILEKDTIDTLRLRIQTAEKPLLVRAVNLVLAGIKQIGTGKSCNIYTAGHIKLALKYTDRISCFDRHVCEIPGKGLELAQQTEFWFKEIEKNLGIPTHFIERKNSTIFAKRCKPIKIEVIVRGYLTGSLAKKRSWPGIDPSVFDNLKPNEKLSEPIVTPTTKSDDHDLPISSEAIVQQNLVKRFEWEKIHDMALRIYRHGAQLLELRGLVLADTKYEFGKDLSTGEIMLMDECHTSDGSRLWIHDSYLSDSKHPKSVDKDFMRNYLRQQEKPNQPIPEEIKKLFFENYQTYTKTLLRWNSTTDSIMEFINKHMVVIVAGSIKDKPWVEEITSHLIIHGMDYKVLYRSAHKNTLDVLKIIETVPAEVYITCAGRSNALSGVIAANSNKPVIACPPFKTKDDYMVNIHSSLQCPSETPVITVLSPSNAALAAKRMIYNK